MRSDAPSLLPIFRSRHQAELLTILLLHPGREYTLTELAKALRSPLTTVQREVDRLVEAGLIAERRAGRTRLLRVNGRGRYTRPLTDLMTLAFGPQVAVGEEFVQVDDVDGVAIYGSWAARYHGEPGPPPNDVDVLVVGQPDRADVYAAADRAEQRLSLPVNTTVCSRSRWLDGEDAFVRQVRSQPLVWVAGDDPRPEAG
jgi:DNA-binding transcriptional ArsR family regulator